MFRFPKLGGHKAAVETSGEQATQDVVEAAQTLKRQADEVIRAAYTLADQRQRERREKAKPSQGS
jgi:hypothetical protein